MEFLTTLLARRRLRDGGGFDARRARLALVLIFATATALGEPAPSREYQIKAVFLFNFAMFVDWPASSFPEEASPFVIAILGDDPFGPYLDEVVRNERIGDRPVEVRRYGRLEEVQECQVLFVGGDEAAQVDRIRENLIAKRALTVGETDGFVRGGGVIAFAVEDGKIRLKINQHAATLAGLTISSKLLRVAEIVNEGAQ